MTIATWILAGQSNMEGFGIPRSRPDRDVDPRIWALTSAGAWEHARDPLHRLWESYTPVHRALMRPDLDASLASRPDQELARREDDIADKGAGLGIPFAKALADATNQEVGLIPAAHSGTSLAQWEPDGSDSEGRTLYGSMLNRVSRVGRLADIRIAGLIWYQGESDAIDGSHEDYAARLTAWIGRARGDLGDAQLPVLIVQLGRIIEAGQGSSSPRAWDTVRDAQRVFPRSIAHTAVTTAVDLGLVDPIHLDAPSLDRLGRRLARLATGDRIGPDMVGVWRGNDTINGMIRLRVECRDVVEGWTGDDHLPGFEVRDAAGINRHATLAVFAAKRDADDPTAIEVLLVDETDSVGDARSQLLESATLGYGLGLDPVCRAVDAYDMALPAFWPQPIGR